MPLRVFNTLTRRKEDFDKIPPARVTMYVCGPTVYKPAHIGHMVGPVIFDTVKRYLTYVGFQVDWVVNITDVDDKLIVRAKELGTTVPALAEKMTADYKDCLAKLNVTGIDRFPKATEHIAGMIGMIGRLIELGYAYAAAGDVYFDVAKDDDYGKLCNRNPDDLEAGTRIEVSDRKRNPGDFALWKGAKPGEPAEVIWDSPWGPGRPGWHIECSVMSQALLGETLDIHGGGLDLKFPHHENELAQSESATGKPFARFWMHNGLLQMGSTKMAGSIGNVVNIVDLLKKHHPETVRFLLLSTHYRSPIEYSEEQLSEKARAIESFYRFFERHERITGENFCQLSVTKHDAPLVARFKERFLDDLSDDFNTGGAVGVLFELVTELNKFADVAKLETERPAAALAEFRGGVLVLRELSNILGLFWAPVTHQVEDPELLARLQQLLAEVNAVAASSVAAAMQTLIDLRNDSRKAKNFAVADTIRKRLTEMKINLEDRPGGKTDWRRG